MATSIVSVSFSNGFVGNATKNNESSASSYLTALGWSNFQFQQATTTGQFGGSQGNDLSGTLLITDAAGVQHRIDGVINWRAPSGAVSTIVFYATGNTNRVLATNSGTYTIDPNTEANGDPHTFIGMTFNGQALAISNDGKVTGNAATSGLLAALNTYLAAQPQLSVGDAVVNEADGTAYVTVTLNKTSTDTITVRYSTENGSATAGTDYAAASGTLTFAPGETSKQIAVSLIDNAVADGARTATVVLSDSRLAAITDNTGVVIINDNDGAPGATVARVLAEDALNSGANPADSSVVEGGSLVYTVTLNGSGGEHTLLIGGTAGASDRGAIGFSNGVAWKNGDPATGIVVVPAGVGSFRITLATHDDSEIENAETVVVTVGGVAATGTVTDNDSQGVTTAIAEDALHSGGSPVDASVVEGASLLVTVALNGASPTPVEHALTVGGSAGALDVGSFVFRNNVAWKNNNLASGIVVVPAGVAGFTILVPTLDDSEVENAESLVLNVGGVAATGTITDNDSIGVSAVLAEDAANAGAIPLDSAVIEGAALQYTVTLSAAGPYPLELSLALGGSADATDLGAISFSDGVAWKNGDPGTGLLVVPAGIGSFRILVATVDDSAVEANESLVLTVGGVQATGTITDNDGVNVATVIAEDAGNVGLSPADSSIVEGGILRYSVHLNTATIAATEFTLAVGGTLAASELAGIVFSDGVTWKNNDPLSGIVVVPSGVGSFKVTVGVFDDAEIELTESLALTVGGVMASGTVTDNDSQSIASLVAEDSAHLGATPVDSSVVEGTALLFTARLNSASPAPTEFTLSLGGSASNADLGQIVFSAGVAWKNGNPASGIIVVPPGVIGFTATLPTVDDALIEATESAIMSIGGVAASGTIADNDSLNVVSVVAEDAANLGQNPFDSVVTEGATLLYTVTLNGAAVAPAEFSLVLGGTASASDLGALVFSNGVSWKNGDPATGIVVIPAGVAGFTATLATVDDSLVESSESALLSVNGVHATGTVVDNDSLPPVVQPPVVQPPVVQPPALQTGLDPDTDDGASNTDAVTSVRTPEFSVAAGQLLTAGGSVRLLAPNGAVVGTSAVTAADIAAGKINVAPGALDDGVYTYTVQIMDASGQVVGSAPVSVTIVTDRDGVMPSVELAAYNGDYNKDGVLDWQQNGVALLPLGSLADFAKGVNAPLSSFGAVIAGSVSGELDAVQLTSGAQLRDLSLTDLPAALPQEQRAASPVFNFTVTAAEGVAGLPDLALNRAGLQTRVVIELGQTGVASNDFLKFDKASGAWYSFLDDQDLATFDDGATLVDLNNDGRVDRIVITLTDGARGDEDGIVNGVIVDPGLLSFDKTLPDQVYSVRMANGELYYTGDVKDAMSHASGTGNVFQGVVFDSMVGAPSGKHASAYYQPFTQDTTFAIDGGAMPYACYELVKGSPGFTVLGANSGLGVNVNLYQDALGRTELATVAQAAQLGLGAKGYANRGAVFSATMDNAFTFDAEGYLIANHDNASVQALVQQLAATYQSTSAAGFIDAVEQNYFQQIQLVGVAHGTAATAADLNAMFGTGFGI